MARFNVDSYQWTGGFIKGMPFAPAGELNETTIIGIPADAPPVTISVSVQVSYDEETGLYESLRLRHPRGYSFENFGPPDGSIVITMPIGVVPGPVADAAVLFGVSGGSETQLSMAYLEWYWAEGCPTCPTCQVGGCGSGGVTLSSPDQNGNSRLSYPFGGGSDPHGLGASAVFGTQSTSWGFMALPDDVSVVNAGQTAETPPRNCIHATVPAGDGTSRLYCSDSATGDFVPAGSYGTSFAWNGSGYVETIGDSQVHYDSSGVLQRVVSGQSEHIYSRGTGWVDITANTATPTKHRYNLQDDNVQSIVEYAQLPGSGWTEARRLEVGWSGSQISSFTSYPGARTTSFSYVDGSLASYEDCSGRAWNLQYEEE